MKWTARHTKAMHESDYIGRGEENSGIKVFRAARHLELIFPLMNLHDLSFSTLLLTGNLLNTSIFSAFNFVLSRHFFSWLPSVLLSASSSLLKMWGSNFKAHKCLSVSGFDRTCCILLILVGVTHVLIISSPTSFEALTCLVAECISVGWHSPRNPFRVL